MISGRELERVSVQVLEQVHEAVAITNMEPSYVWVNDEFCRLTGYSRSEIIGEPVSTLRSNLHPGEYYEQMYHAVFHEEGKWQGEVLRRKKDGKVFPAWLTVSRIHDAETDSSYAVDLFIDLDQIQQGRERLESMVNHDALTGLPNRRLLWDRLGTMIRRAQRQEDSPISVMFIDIDNFKRVNDSLGHQMGDRLLVQLANALLSSLRGADTVARVGGDEFVVLLSGNVRNEDNHALERVQRALDQVSDELPRHLNIGASIGVAVFPEDGTGAGALYSVADQRMYADKAARDRGR